MNHKIKLIADASLPALDLAFPTPFLLFKYKNEEELVAHLKNQEILLCRSSLKIDKAFLKESSLKTVATASSGVDHIDQDYLNHQGIRLVDAKGSNALAVADYILASLAYLQKEQGFKGKKIGIVGLGEVGTVVAKRLAYLGFHLSYYDPFVASFSQNWKDILSSDLISLHANLHDKQPFPTRRLCNADFFAQLKPKAILINTARGEIVDEQSLLTANKDFIYCTDVFSHEPAIHEEVIARATIATPHIAGHTIEAKKRAVYVVSEKLHRAYGLKPPTFESLEGREIIDLHFAQWQTKILAVYNPIHETLALKKALDKTRAFLHLRKEHCRGEFQVLMS